MKRLDALYRGQEPELPEISFQDYAYWLQNRDSKTVAGEESYWKERMEGAGELLDLPVDKQRPKPSITRVKNVVSPWRRNGGPVRRILQKGRLLSLYAVRGGFCVLLSKYTGSSDIIIGTPVSGGGSRSFGMFWGRF